MNTIISDNILDMEYINSILKCLKKLVDEVPKLVQQQIQSNQSFPQELVKYYSDIMNIHFIIVDGLILLSLIFDEKKNKYLADGNLANALLKYIGYFKNSEIFLNLALIIMKLSTQEQFIDVCVKHENIQLILEFLPKYLNEAEKKDQLIPLVFIGNILEKDGDIFHPRDFKVLQELCIRNILDGEDFVRQLSIRCLFYFLSYGSKELLMQQQIRQNLKDVLLNCKDAFSKRKSQQVLYLL